MMSRQRLLRQQPRVCYFEPEEPNLDEYVFCEKCGDYVYEYCSIHGALLVVPDDKVPAKPNFPEYVPRAALTIPHVFLHINYSSIPEAGLGVFTTLTLPCGVRFGPYRGERTRDVTSDYSWQIYDRNRKPSHVIDASDPNKSNWMRYVNCARHWAEQNLVAFQYQGQLYYRTIRIIPKFTELMVFYGTEYANHLDIDLSKYNSPTNYAQKFGAPAPKKPKFGVKNKKSQQGTALKHLEEHNKSVQLPSAQGTSKPRTDVQDSADERNGSKDISLQYETGAPAPKKPKFGVKKKKVSPGTFVRPSEQRKEPVQVPSTQDTTPPGSHVRDASSYLNDNNITLPSRKGAPAPKKRKIKVKRIETEAEDIVKPINLENKKLQTTKQNEVNSTIEVNKKTKIIQTSKAKKPTSRKLTKTIDKENNVVDNVNTTSGVNCTDADIDVTKHVHDEVTTNSDTVGNESTSLNRQQTNICQITSKKQNVKRIEIQHAYFLCDVCNYRDISKESIQKHMNLHDTKRKLVCDNCTYRFTTSRTLNNHKLTRHGITSDDMEILKCNICEYRTTLKEHLKTHLLKHAGLKSYSCDICDFKCSRASTLKRHLRIHTGEKPYSCDICGYKCSQAGTLKDHLRIHTGEKPYTCSICGYKCSRAGNLKYHLRIHTEEKPYSCSICGYKCSRAGNLKYHLRIHTEEKPYSCDICDYKCSHRLSLNNHLKKKHLK